MKNKVVSIIALLLLISFFVGVSSGFAASSSEEKIDISFTWWGDTRRHEIYNKIINLFEAANPNIKVDRLPGSWGQYWEKLSTQIAGGNAPDVIGMHQRYVSDYARRGALLNLKPYVDSGVIDISALPESVYQGGFVNDILCMLPQGVNITGIIYNTATFDELGVPYPDPDMDWTWKEYAAKAIEIRKAAKTKGLDMWGGINDDSRVFSPFFQYYVRSNGENLYTEDGDLGFSEETLVNWFKYWKDLREKGAIPEVATTYEYFDLPLEQNLFTIGKVGMMMKPANQLTLYQDQVKNEGTIEITRIPHLEGKQAGEYIGGSYLAVTSNSDHPEAAAKFISFFINDAEAQKTFMLEQGVPPTTTAIEIIFDDLTATQKRIIDFESKTMKIAKKATYPPVGSSEIMSLFEDINEAISFGQLTPEEGAAQFMQDAKDILSRS